MDLDDRLRAAGHRVTAPRRLVWKVLSAEHRHLTAHEVLEAARRRDPGLNLSSVYRSLTLLAELGLVRESRMSGDGASRWELLHADDVIHLVCEECGSIEHHSGPFVEELRSHLAGHHQFQASSVELTVSGRCSRCAQRAGSAESGEPGERAP